MAQSRQSLVNAMDALRLAEEEALEAALARGQCRVCGLPGALDERATCLACAERGRRREARLAEFAREREEQSKASVARLIASGWPYRRPEYETISPTKRIGFGERIGWFFARLFGVRRTED